MLARTCVKCGIFADGDSFPAINQGKGGRRKACHICVNTQKKRDREERGIGVPTPRPPEASQTNKRLPWTEEDDEYLRSYAGHKTYEDIALHLGRSLKAVYVRRRVLGIAKVRKQHRVANPWKLHT